jgi:hypothetical protein
MAETWVNPLSVVVAMPYGFCLCMAETWAGDNGFKADLTTFIVQRVITGMADR